MPDPADPITALAAGAFQLHEIYSAYVEAGFTRTEALCLVTAILTEGIRNLPPAQEGQ